MLLPVQIANAFFYNPSLTLGTLHKLGVAAEVFNLWFMMLQQTKKGGVRKNFRRYFSFFTYPSFVLFLCVLG
jgi:importin-7